MRTQIIEVSPNDDLTLIMEKVKFLRTSRAILHYNSPIQVLPELFDLKRLRRTAISNGIELAIVTDNTLLRYTCQEAGLVVFDDTKTAQTSRWWKPDNRLRVKKPSWKRIGTKWRDREKHNNDEFSNKEVFVSSGLLISYLVALLIIFVPRAEVTIYQTSAGDLNQSEGKNQTEMQLMDSQIKLSILGKRTYDAKAIIGKIESTSVEVSISPDWYPFIPLLPIQISISRN